MSQQYGTSDLDQLENIATRIGLYFTEEQGERLRQVRKDRVLFRDWMNEPETVRSVVAEIQEAIEGRTEYDWNMSEEVPIDAYMAYRIATRHV